MIVCPGVKIVRDVYEPKNHALLTNAPSITYATSSVGVSDAIRESRHSYAMPSVGDASLLSFLHINSKKCNKIEKNQIGCLLAIRKEIWI